MRIQAKVAVAPPVDRDVSQRPERERQARALGELSQDRGQRVRVELVAVAPGRQRLVRALEPARDALRVHTRSFALR